MKQVNWKNAIYYGEVFGFLFAWAVCLAVALSYAEEDANKSDARNIAAAGMGAAGLD